MRAVASGTSSMAMPFLPCHAGRPEPAGPALTGTAGPIGRNVAREEAHRALRSAIGARSAGRADRRPRASPTNGDPHQAHWSVLELTYPRAQRFGKQAEADARERLSRAAAAGRAVWVGCRSSLSFHASRTIKTVFAPSDVHIKQPAHNAPASFGADRAARLSCHGERGSGRSHRRVDVQESG